MGCPHAELTLWNVSTRVAFTQHLQCLGESGREETGTGDRARLCQTGSCRPSWSQGWAQAADDRQQDQKGQLIGTSSIE